MFLCPEELNEASTDSSAETEPSSDADFPTHAFDEVDGPAPAHASFDSASYPHMQTSIKQEPTEFTMEKSTISQSHSVQQLATRHDPMAEHQASFAGQQVSLQVPLTGQQAPEKQVMMPEDSASGEGCTGEESAA